MYLIITIFLLIMIIMTAKSYSMLNYLIFIEYSVLLMIFFIIANQLMNDWMFMMYMVFTVSESIIGLTLMMTLNQSYGHQNINAINLCLN